MSENWSDVSLSAAEELFAAIVRKMGPGGLGVGFGMMQSIVERCWRDRCPQTAWGPAYLEERIQELETEVEVLRSFGNKDCTAMADEELERRKVRIIT